jgi:hypothetical protein
MSSVLPDAVGRMPAVVMTQAYKKQGLHLLKSTFPLLSVASIRKVYDHVEFQFTAAYVILVNMYRHLGKPEFDRCVLEVAPFLLGTKWAWKIQIELRKPRKVTCVGVDDPILRQELLTFDAVIAKVNANFERQVEVASLLTLKDPPPLAPDIITLECVCCFGDYPIEESCQCKDGHLFCCSCIRGYVQEEVFGKNSCDLRCLSMESCALGFSNATLEKALPAKVLANYHKLVYQKGVEAAGVENLV